MLARAIAIASLAAACYSPRVRDCSVQCSSERDCTGGETCGSDGFCAMPGVAGRCATTAIPDAVLPGSPRDAADARSDAPPNETACQTACTNGTCESGVCVIDCSMAGTCLADVHCPAGVACRVVCGDRSCTHHVVCPMSAPCEIECTGQYACSDVIQCGSGPCTVACSGYAACHKAVSCMNACACDVACTGATSCPAASMCPLGNACAYGHGCTSTLPGCDRCQ